MNDRTRGVLLLGVAIASAVVTVVAGFNPAPHTGGDNAAYLTLAHGLVSEGAYVDAYDPQRLPHTKYPPVFPLLLAALIAVGAKSWTAFKSVAAVATVGSVALTYLWGRHRLGETAALAVAVLVAFSAAFVYYSHWVLSDPVFVALTLAAILGLDLADDDGASPGWLALGVGCVLLAYFTRQAGLPLLVGMLAWLGLRRRWKELGVAAGVTLLPALLWSVRARASEVASYGEEFWMSNPYDPGLGTVGVGGLIGRAVANAGGYVARHGPAGIIGSGSQLAGSGSQLLLAVGVGVTVSALVGWVIAVRERIGPAELFLPLYTGLILLWPEVWSGDRFALPLYPVAFVYAAVALRAVGDRFGAIPGSLLAGAAFLTLFLPAASHWTDEVRVARTCASLVRSVGEYACYRPAVDAFVSSARWMGSELPDGAVVLSRKPRVFHLNSGLTSRAFAFDEDPQAQLSLADELGARYVMLDEWDGLSLRYVGGAVQAWPTAFCFVAQLSVPSGATTRLLGILPPLARGARPEVPSPPNLMRCPAGYLRNGEAGAVYSLSSSTGSRIPLFDGPGS